MSAAWFPGDAQVIEVAKLIAEKGLSLVEAMAEVGVQWSEKTFAANIRRVAARKGLGSGMRGMLSRALQRGVGQSLMTSGVAAGGIGAWIAAHPLLALALLAAAGFATAGIAQAAGTYMADGPSAIAGPGSGRTPHTGDPAKSGGGWLPVAVVVNGRDRIVSVRSVDAIRQGIHAANFRHGGIARRPAQLRVLAGSLDRPFRDAGTATAALADMLTGPLRKPPLADGLTASMGGANVTVDDWGRVDFIVLRDRLR
ncbi:MAG: hypothetical protein H6805_00185 [Planctomycetes bacterium]|nr:hypothetical protein [Planctomycetota bacterium]